MKTDRELLELAAKAAGIEHAIVYDEEDGCGPYVKFSKHGYWQPLTNDGDALRLLSQLEISLQLDSEDKTITAWRWNRGTLSVKQDYSCNELSAGLRRAIVRLAASIGETINES